MGAWPSTIDPYPLNETYAHVFADARQRQQMEQGPGRQRRLYSKAPVKLQMEWMFSPADFQTFRDFFDGDADLGAASFNMPVFTGSDYETVSVRFVKGSVKPSRAEGEWKVAATLECDELPVMTSGALDGIIGAAPAPGPDLPAWPSQWSVNPLEQDFGLTLPEPTLRSDFEDGYLPQSRLFRNAPALYAATFPMPNAQYDAFRAWLVYRAYDGEGWFSISVFRGDEYVTQAARIRQGTLKATRQGEDWLVHATLELRALPPFVDTDPIGLDWTAGGKLLWTAGSQIMVRA